MTTALAESAVSTDPSAPGHPPGQAPDTVVRCVGLSKVFRDFWLRSRVTAVDQIDLDIHRGEVFGLLGPNGSGKSTTIKMILGLLHPTGGRIAVFGHHPQDVAIKNMIGYVPEESYLYQFLNARETLEYYAKLFHLPRAKRKVRIDQLLEYVGLDKVAGRPVGEYSKGMQRRIGLAQALINDPKLLILDEPTTGMDPLGTRQIKDLILDLKRKGKTILLCSHLLADVEDVTDRVAIMFGGAIRQSGPVRELLTKRETTTLATGSLDPQTIEEIEQVLARRGKHIERIDHPRQKLEELFLDIVNTAQQEGAATSGAGSGGKLAAFLSNEPDQPVETEGDAVLDELVNEQAAPEPEPVEPPAESAPPPPQADHVLDALTGSAPPPPPEPSAPKKPEPSAPAPTAPQTEDEQPDQSLLDDLTGGDGKKP